MQNLQLHARPTSKYNFFASYIHVDISCGSFLVKQYFDLSPFPSPTLWTIE